MKRFLITPMLALANMGFAQPPAPPADPPQQTAPQTPAPPQDGGWRRLNNGPAPAPQGDPNFQQSAPAPIPPKLTLKAGTYVTVRINNVLSSDHNHAGDAFSATLVQPIVVNGIVVAERGQTVGGKVTEAKKAGMVQGTSHLGVQLIDLPVADGQQIPIQTSLVSRSGPTTVGRDVGAVAGTTALGAAVGAAADWGRGSAIGAGAGAAVGLIGVLLTRGAPTYITPESVLTFRIEQPVEISTEHTPQAFRYVEPGDYSAPAPSLQRRPPPPTAFYGPGYYPAYYPYAYPYPYYWGGFYGPYWGPGFVIGFHGRHW